MKDLWTWIVGFLLVLILIAQVATVRSSRQSYWIIRGAEDQRVVVVQELSDQAMLWRLHHYYQR
jgi:hypothetical protein